MNKTEFVEQVASKANLSKKHAEEAVNAFIEVVHSAFESGEKIALQGFGTFETRKRAARNGRHPQTGEVIQVAETIVPAFKPGNVSKEKAKAKKA